MMLFFRDGFFEKTGRRFGEPGKKLSLLLTQVLLPRGLTGVRSTTVAFEVGFPFQCLLSSKGTGREKSF